MPKKETEKVKNSQKVSYKGQLGGYRPGAGFPKGQKKVKTLEKMAVLDAYRQKAMTKADQLLQAQLALALGSVEVFIVEHYEDEKGREKKRHIRVDDPELMANILDDPELVQGDNYVVVKTVTPDIRAIDSILDRAFGKPVQGYADESDTTLKEREIQIQETLANAATALLESRNNQTTSEK